MLPETRVAFRTENTILQRVFDAAEEKCRQNLRDFGGRTVLVEGGGYEKIWLETQPMGGEMYALRNPEAALNNCLMFMEHQRADGRLPGSIHCSDGRIEPQFNKYQGFCFPFHALNLYWLFGRDEAYLNHLKDVLIRFDACLWRTRHLTGNGILSSFCVYDTGEDLALRYGDAPCYWEEDTPPEGYQVVPMASMDVTSWSYACRHTVAEICRIQRDPATEEWARIASEVTDALRKHLWNRKRGALYDRDRQGKTIDILCHNTLRCMYWGSISQSMANRFVKDHLLNPAEFWTRLPLPSVAANDPAFRNAPENNWSGQPEGLTYQRAITALENYGYCPIVTALGSRLIHAVYESGCRFTQQYDPFTGKPSLVCAATHQLIEENSRDTIQDDYGPTMLACLEYIAHHYGIHPHMGTVWFSLGSGSSYEYEAECYGHQYRILSNGQKAEIQVDGKAVGTWKCGIRIIAQETGQVVRMENIESE